MLVSYCTPQIDTVTPHTKKVLEWGGGQKTEVKQLQEPHVYFPVHKANDGQDLGHSLYARNYNYWE